jgi:uncharacterized membrane protein YjfL (UPF0719 family)
MDPVFDIVSTVIFLFADLLIGIFATFLISKAFAPMFLKSKGLQFLKKGNAAASLLLVSIIISVALLCSDTIMTVQQNLHLAVQTPEPERTGFVASIALFGFLQVLASIGLGLGVAFLSAKLFDLLTKEISELKEIEDTGNMAAGILLAGIIVGLTIFVKYPFSSLVEFLVPMPSYTLPI